MFFDTLSQFAILIDRVMLVLSSIGSPGFTSEVWLPRSLMLVMSYS